MTNQNHMTITPMMVAKLRTRIGVERKHRNPWITQAARDSIRHWAWGIGDDNPLWSDFNKTGHDQSDAPPTFLYSFNHGPLGPGAPPSRGTGMPGIHGLHLGDRWDFLEVVKIGDEFDCVEKLTSVEERSGAYSSRQVLQTIETEFRRRSDQRIVALLTHKKLSTERGDSTSRDGKYVDVQKWVYTNEELEKIASDYGQLSRRGSLPRYWDDVSIGQELGLLVKGPLNVQSLISFWACWGCNFGMSDQIWYDFIRSHPNAIFRDPDSNVPDVPDAAHYDERFANQIGFPVGYDIGVQRISWFGQLLTDWAGDTGRILMLDVQLRRPNWLGDTTWIRGEVVSKELANNDATVNCRMWADSQRGERHSIGEAIVALARTPGLDI